MGSEEVCARGGRHWLAGGKDGQRSAHFRAQSKELEAGLAARVGVQADNFDRDFVAVVGEGVWEPGEQFEVLLAGRRVGHSAEGQGLEL
ncbi:hypothetical protein [Streptomyces sp. Ncost-T10-10d]|uniref:hypothetical protein n=1 Tax=Streptomyces sp. Ncost-T10-10d TaxID=1839774 RepID=UPI000B83D08E|nr:hypothetical protein [Streptomyces sp. Ncost-T10-10d]